MRIIDCVYRYGGEEFVIIANSTELEQAGKFAEYLRELVEENLEVGDHKITVSIDVSEISIDDTEESWLHRADLALYDAKESSRNTVFLAAKNCDKKTFSYHSHLLQSSESKSKSEINISDIDKTRQENQGLR